jgi:FkbM family methyltransferase
MENALKVILANLKKIIPTSVIISLYIFLCRNKYIRSLLNNVIKRAIPEYLQLVEGTIFLDKNDAVVSGALTFGVYEQFEASLFKKTLKLGMKVVDIGANIGYYTLIASKLVGDSGKVFAFEPDDTNFSLLEKSISYNKRTNTTLFHSALGNFVGTAELFLSESNKGDHRVYQVTDENRSKIAIKMTTLDSAIGSESIDVIKMDVQGAEGLVCAGMSKVIDQSPDLILFTEFWPEGLKKTGTDPGVLLSELLSKFKISIINEKNKSLVPLVDSGAFFSEYTGRKYANLMCKKHS